MVRRWLKIGAGIASSVASIIGLFVLLSLNFGFVITDLTGNFSCSGTYEDPCISMFDVRNPTSANVDIYSKDQTKLDFSPGISDYALFAKDGRCGATGACRCVLKNGDMIGFKGWRCVDFTNETKPRADRVYNFRFPAYSTTHFLIAGIKNHPSDKIKWGFGAADGYLDPVWDSEDFSIESKWKVTHSSGKEAELTHYTADAKDKKTIQFFQVPNNDCTGWTSKKLFYADDPSISDINSKENTPILDNKNKEMTIKCESNKFQGMSGYYLSLTDAKAVNIDNNVKLGENSVDVKYIKEILYAPSSDYNITAYLTCSEDIWVNNSKFGANYNVTGDYINCTYEFESNLPAEIHIGQLSFKINRTHSVKVDTKDICSNINETNDCTYSIYNFEGIGYAYVDFFDKDGVIDPTYNMSIDPIEDAINHNIKISQDISSIQMDNYIARFDGIDDYISFADSGFWRDTSTSNQLLAFWIYPRGTGGIIGQKGSGDGWAIRTNSDNTINLTQWNGGGTLSSETSSYTLPQDEWTYLSFSSGSGGATLYVNGLIEESFNNPNKLDQDSDPIYLGRAFNHTGLVYIDADIDELVFINATGGGAEALKAYERGKQCLMTDDELTHYYCFSNSADDEEGSIDGVMNAEAITVPDLGGLVAYWNFDDSSTVARDWAGNNDGTYQDDAHPTDDGKYGKGLFLDGDGDHVNYGTSFPLNAEEFTLSAWVRIRSTGITQEILHGAITAWDDDVFNFHIMNNERAQLLNDYNINVYAPAEETIVVGEWQHVAVTVNNHTQNATLYVNGIGVMTDTTFSMPKTSILAYKMNIGSNAGTALGLNGTLDEIMIFNKALNASEINDLYYQNFQRFKETANQTFSINFTSGDNRVNITVVDYKTTKASITYNYANIEDCLVAYLDSEENICGSIDGSLAGTAVWNDGRNPPGTKVLTLGGNSDYIDTGYDTEGANNTGITIGAWFKFNGTVADDLLARRIITTHRTTSSTHLAIGLNNEAGTVKLGTYYDGANELYASTEILPNVWYYAAAKYDNDTDEIKIYLNGVEANSASHALGGQTLPSNARIGVFNTGTESKWFQGDIDEPIIITRSLSNTEIGDIYNASLGQYTSTNLSLCAGSDCQVLVEDNTTYDYASSFELIDAWIDSNNSVLGLHEGPYVGTANFDGTGRGTIGNKTLVLDGVGDFLSIDDQIDNIINNTDYTICAWVKPNSTGAFPMGVMGAKYGGNTEVGFRILTNADAECIYRGLGGARVLTPSPGVIFDQWNYVCCVADRSDKQQVWINGIGGTTESINDGLGIAGTGTVPFKVGSNVLSEGEFDLNGQVDEAAAWNRTLNSSEINEIYRESKQGHSNPVEFTIGTGVTDLNITYKAESDVYNFNSPWWGNKLYYKTFTEGEANDTTAPNITIHSPISQTYTTANISINITSTDVNLDTCFYSLSNGTGNTTYTCNTQFYKSFTDGDYNFTAYANDTSGNLNLSIVNFTVADSNSFSDCKTFSTPGTYTAIADIVPIIGSSCFLIDTDDLILDFNGTTIVNDTFKFRAFSFLAAHDNVTIKNIGELRINYATNTAYGISIFSGSDGVVLDNIVFNNSYIGIRDSGTNNVIVKNSIITGRYSLLGFEYQTGTTVNKTYYNVTFEDMSAISKLIYLNGDNENFNFSNNVMQDMTDTSYELIYNLKIMDNAIIENNDIKDNAHDGTGSSYFYHGTGASSNITNSVFRNNNFSELGFNSFVRIVTSAYADNLIIEDTKTDNIFTSYFINIDDGNDVTLRNNLFDNVSTGVRIIDVSSIENLNISNNNFTNMNDDSTLVYIYVGGGSTDAEINFNKFIDNQAASYGGIANIHLEEAYDSSIFNNTWENSIAYLGIEVTGPATNISTYNNNVSCTALGGSHGIIYRIVTEDGLIYDNNIEGCNFGLLFHNGSRDNVAYNNYLKDNSISVYILDDAVNNTISNYTDNNGGTGVHFFRYNDRRNLMPSGNVIDNAVFDSVSWVVAGTDSKLQRENNYLRNIISTGASKIAELDNSTSIILTNVTSSATWDVVDADSSYLRKWWYQARSGGNIITLTNSSDTVATFDETIHTITSKFAMIEYENIADIKYYPGNYTADDTVKTFIHNITLEFNVFDNFVVAAGGVTGVTSFIAGTTTADSTLWAIDFTLEGAPGTEYDAATCGSAPIEQSLEPTNSFKEGPYALSYNAEKGSYGSVVKSVVSIFRYPMRTYADSLRVFFRINTSLSSGATYTFPINVTEILSRTGTTVAVNTSNARIYRINSNGGIYQDGACLDQAVTI